MRKKENKPELEKTIKNTASPYTKENMVCIQNVEGKLNRGEKLSEEDLAWLAYYDDILYEQAKELTRRREIYSQRLFQTEEGEKLHIRTTEKLGRQVARTKSPGDLRMLRWRIMAAQDCYRAFIAQTKQEKPTAPQTEKQAQAPKKGTAVPTPQQLAELMRANASGPFGNAGQMSKLMKELLGGEEKEDG